MVTSFRYLGRVISAADENWLTVILNLGKSWAVWIRMMRILSKEGARPRVYGFFFNDVVQSVLLFCVGTWVVTPRMVRVLGGFQYQVSRRTTGRILRRRGDGNLEYTSVDVTREEEGLDKIKTYIHQK